MVAVALLSLLILLWKDWPPHSSSAEQSEESMAEGAASRETTPDLLARLKPPADRNDYASIIERPIFRPERKPEPPPEEVPEVTEASKAGIELKTVDLSAVMITPTIVSAWVKDPGQPKLLRLRIGDDLEGWLVRDILEDRVLLERQGEEYALILRDYSKAPQTAAPTPVPRRPPPRTTKRAEPRVIER